MFSVYYFYCFSIVGRWLFRVVEIDFLMFEIVRWKWVIGLVVIVEVGNVVWGGVIWW